MRKQDKDTGKRQKSWLS